MKVQNREKIVNVNLLFCYRSYIWSLIEMNDLLHASLNINILLASMSIVVGWSCGSYGSCSALLTGFHQHKDQESSSQ